MSSHQRTHGPTAAFVLLVAIFAMVGFIAGCGEESRENPSGGDRGGSPRLFAADSIWNADLPRDAELDPNSKAITASLQEQVAMESERGNGPWINTYEYSTPIYTVPRHQSTTRVVLDARTDMPNPDPALQRAWNEVPLPKDARPARGTDAHLTVLQPSTDTLWEFFGMYKKSGTWHARWGGAMRNVSKSPGYFSARSWPGAIPHWGATATSLPLVAGTMRISDIRDGRIDHALAIAIPHARAGSFSQPAQRTDGDNRAPTAVPEGAHFRLDPDLDIDAMQIHPVAKAMAKAAQRHGIVVRDQSGVVSFYAEDPTPTGDNPYPKLFRDQYPSAILKQFPWEHLQLLKMSLSGN